MPETVLYSFALVLSLFHQPSPRLLLTLSSAQAAEANLRRQLEQTLAADPSIPLHHHNLVRFVLHCINLAVVVHALLCGA